MYFIPQKSQNNDANSRSLNSSLKFESAIPFYHFRIQKNTPKCFTRLKITKTKAKGEVRVFKIWRLV